MQPLLVRLLGGEFALDLVVGTDLAARGVDEEHAPGLQPALRDDARLVEVEHTRFAGEHDQAVLRLPPPTGTQPVAVEHRADDCAVGERDARRPVPRLDQRRVELVERTTIRIHRGVVLPRLRDHHEHRVRQAAPAEVQQLERLVEGGRVGRVRSADREQPPQVARDEVGLEQRLAGAHPVAVAADGVELAVVRDVAERVRERPGRERVGREPAVHQRERAGEPLVGQVGEELTELIGREHALVDDRAARQRREVQFELVLARSTFAHPAGGKGAPLELEVTLALGAGEEHLPEARHDALGRRSDGRIVGRHVAPAENGQPLFGGRRLDDLDNARRSVLVQRQECRPACVGAGLGQVDSGDGAQELVRELQRDARAVAGRRLGAGGAAVVEVVQRGQCLRNDGVAPSPGQVGEEGDATRVLLVGRVVQSLRGRHGRERGHGSPVDVARRGRGGGRSGRRWPVQRRLTLPAGFSRPERDRCELSFPTKSPGKRGDFAGPPTCAQTRRSSTSMSLRASRPIGRPERSVR